MTDPQSHGPLPRFVVVGQGKAGTSLLFRRLKAIPEIGLSHPKELHYFSANHAKGDAWYRSHFAHLSQTDPDLVGEVSPSYLKPGMAARIASTLGRDVKIIFILRHPVEQSYSRYIQNLSAKAKGGSFSRIMRTVGSRLGKLTRAMDEYYELFGPDRILPMVFEADITAPDEPYLRKVLQHIGLPHAAPKRPAREVNTGVMPRYLWSGGRPLEVTSNGAAFEIPAQRLVFCAQRRNSTVIEAPSQAQVTAALREQSGWSADVSEAEFAYWHEHYVKPFAAGITQRYGIDLSAWENRARRLSYALASPPEEFRLASPPVVAPEDAPEPGPEEGVA